MKTKFSNRFLANLGLITVALSACHLHAAPLYKVNNSDNLNLTSSWTDTSGLINPPVSIGATDALYFNEINMQGDKTLALGGNLAVGGLAVDYVATDSANNVTISAGNTLTLNGTTLYGNGQHNSGGIYNTAGIVLNRGTGGALTIGSDIALGAAQQWVSGRSGTNGFTVNGNVALGANALSLNVAAGVSTISGVISGTGKVTKIGGGTLQLPNGNPTFSGGFQLGPDAGASNVGVVLAGNAGSLGTADIISRGTQLRSSVAGLNITNNFTVGAGGFRVGGTNNFTLSGTTTLDNSSRSLANYGTATVTLGNITLGGIASRAAFDVGGNFVVNGNITGTGSTTPGTGAVIVTAGRVAFNGTNTYTGQTNVTGGTITGTGNFPTLLAMSGGSIALPGGGTTGGALTFGAGATFTNAPTVSFDAAPIAATTYDVFNYAGTLTGLTNLKSGVRGTFNNTGTKVTFTPGTANQTRTWNPALAAGNWDGTGTAANWLEGDNLFYNGDLAVFNEPNAATTVTLTGPVSATGFTVNNTANAYTFAGALTGSTGLTKTGAGAATFNNAGHSYTGNVTISGGTVAASGASGNTNTALGLSSSGRTVTVNNAGTLSLVGNNVFGGGAQTLANTIKTVINAGGTMTANAYNVVGNIDLNGGTLTATGGSGGAYQTYEFNGSTVTVGGSATSLISSTAPSNGGMHIAGGKTLTLDVADATGDANTDLTISASLRNGSNDRAGNGSLLKTGAGTATLDGANVYSGTTTVNGGTLGISGSLAGDAAINVTAGATFATSGAGTIGTAATSAATITNDGTVRFGSSAAQTFNGFLTGTGSLVKTGTGTLTLGAASTADYTGPTTVSGGTLAVNGFIDNSNVMVNGTGNLGGQGQVIGDVTIDGGSITGNNPSVAFTVGSVTFGSAGTVNIGPLANYEFLPAIESIGNLTLNGGAASVVVNLPTAPVAAGTYQLIASANTLANTNAFTLGTIPALGARQSGNLVANTGSLDYVVTGLNPTWTGDHSGEWSTATLPSPKNWFTNVETDYIDGDTVRFDGTATGTTAVLLNTTVIPTSTLFDFDSPVAYSLTGTGSIAGTGSLTKSGTGTLTLGTANSHSGGTIVNGGTLNLSSGATLGSGAVTLNNGQLTLTGHTLANNIATTNGTLGGTTAQIDGVISGTTLNINTTGIVKFTAVNTYTGDTNITSGGLEILGSGQLNSGNYAGAITNPALLRFDTTADQILGGAISGNGSLVKNNTNTLSLTGPTPAYIGTTTVNAGTLVLATPSFGKVASPTINVNSGATLRIDSTNILYTGSNYCTVVVDGGTVNLNANHNHFGPLTLNNGATVNGIRPTDSYDNVYSAFDREVTVGGTITSTISGNLPNVGYDMANATQGGFTVNPTGDASGVDLLVPGLLKGGALVKNGTGVMKLTAANTYTGNTTINAGVLDLSAGQIYTGGYQATAVVTVNAGGTVKINNFAYNDTAGSSASFGGLRDYGAARVLNGGTFEVLGTGHSAGNNFNVDANGGTFRYVPALDTDTLTLSGNGNSNIAVNGALTVDTVGNITINEVITGTGSITKVGAGTLTLGGSNTISGESTVNAGTLAVTGSSLADGASLTVDGGVVNLTGNETVDSLYFGATQKAAGTWGATGSGAANIDDTRFSGTGMLTVTNGPVVSGYATWSATNAPGQTADQDFDGDGVSNGVEWVLGGDKDTNDADKLPTISQNSTDMIFTFVREQDSKTPDTTVTIEVGTSLATWPNTYPVPDSGTLGPVTVVDNANGTETVTLTVTKAPDATKFGRLNVTIN